MLRHIGLPLLLQHNNFYTVEEFLLLCGGERTALRRKKFFSVVEKSDLPRTGKGSVLTTLRSTVYPIAEESKIAQSRISGKNLAEEIRYLTGCLNVSTATGGNTHLPGLMVDMSVQVNNQVGR